MTYGQFAWYGPLFMMMDVVEVVDERMIDVVGRKWSC